MLTQELHDGYKFDMKQLHLMIADIEYDWLKNKVVTEERLKLRLFVR